MRLKIRDSHLTCKVENKCLNVLERVEVVEWNKRRSPPFPCCPVSRQCPWKKTLIEKKPKKTKVIKIFTLKRNTFYIKKDENTASPKISPFLVLPSKILLSFWNTLLLTQTIKLPYITRRLRLFGNLSVSSLVITMWKKYTSWNLGFSPEIMPV